jgi:hypothetical protein
MNGLQNLHDKHYIYNNYNDTNNNIPRYYPPEEEDDDEGDDDDSTDKTVKKKKTTASTIQAPGTNAGRWSNDEHQRVSFSQCNDTFIIHTRRHDKVLTPSPLYTVSAPSLFLSLSSPVLDWSGAVWVRRVAVVAIL